MRCQPVAPAGCGGCRRSACSVPGPSVDRTVIGWVPDPRARTVFQRRQANGSISASRSVRCQVLPSSVDTSTRRMRGCRPRPRPATVNGEVTVAWSVGVSMRDSVWTMASESQPRWTQYPRCGCVGEREAGQPLDVLHAVVAGYQQSGREPVAAGQREAVHAERDHRPVGAQHVDRERLVIAVGRLDKDPGGPWLRAGELEERGRGDTGPAGVADEWPAHRVGDAAECDDTFDGRHGAQVVEAERQRPVDEPVHDMAPRRFDRLATERSGSTSRCRAGSGTR